MAPTHSPGYVASISPKNFHSLSGEDLFPNAGRYVDGRDSTWFDAFSKGMEDIKTLSVILNQADSAPWVAEDINYVQTRLIERWQKLEGLWLEKALEDGPERWKDAEDWVICDAHHAQNISANNNTSSESNSNSSNTHITVHRITSTTPADDTEADIQWAGEGQKSPLSMDIGYRVEIKWKR